MIGQKFRFTSEIFLWKEDSPWHFIALPEDITDDIEDSVSLRGGFGSISVHVTLGTSNWSTSLFPDSRRKAFILPIKKEIRRAEQVAAGDRVTIELAIAT